MSELKEVDAAPGTHSFLDAMTVVSFKLACGCTTRPGGPSEAAWQKRPGTVLIEPGRKRPFHWHREGPAAKARLVDCLIEVGAVSHICVHYPTGRKKTEAARAAGLRQIIPLLLVEGTTELIIESRAAQDARDRAVILDVLQDLGTPGALAYHWRPKAEPFLWLADGVCGAVRGFLLGDPDQHHYDRLCQAGIIGDLIYINDDPGPQHA